MTVGLQVELQKAHLSD